MSTAPRTDPTRSDPPTPPHAGVSGFKVVLISPYELGRQPFALAEPTAILRQAGFEVACLDLSQQRLSPTALAGAGLVAIYLGMHTATRIALEALPRIRELAPAAQLCAYGLYAPMNAPRLRELGFAAIFGGEVENELLALAQRLSGVDPGVVEAKVRFVVPDRTALPPLAGYAHLTLPDGQTRRVGFAEGSRGCKHLCRHCPVVPVYRGQFRAVPVDVVIADIRQQVAAGATHISLGDPDFFNGPTHARRLVQALHAEFPTVTFDATVKIEHILAQLDLLPELQQAGCLFITSAVESIDDQVLGYLDKGHTRADFVRAVEAVRAAGIDLAPTFMPFTPWTRLEGYIELLQQLITLRLVESVPPIQLSIRLLVPDGSYLLELEGFRALLAEFDPVMLGHRWVHADARVDALQQQVQRWVADADKQGLSRRETFTGIWGLAHAALDRTPPALPADLGHPIAAMSEPWYCCAEPTDQQLQGF